MLPGPPHPKAPISCPWGCRSCRSAQEPSRPRSPRSRPPETFAGLPAAPGHDLCPPDPAPFGPSQAGPGQGRPMGSDCAPGSPEDTSAPPARQEPPGPQPQLSAPEDAFRGLLGLAGISERPRDSEACRTVLVFCLHSVLLSAFQLCLFCRGIMCCSPSGFRFSI